MPQLKKVALGMGNRLAYADTYEQSLSQLIASLGGIQPVPSATPAQAPTTTATRTGAPPPAQLDAAQTLNQLREHLRRYRELNAQGKWAEAGKELEEIQRLLEK